LLIAILLAVAGQLGRALGTNVEIFLLLSLLTMIGLGLGNIVLPPLVKKYFPDRVGLLTALYVTLLAISTAVAPQLAVPISGDAAGWRVAVGVWSLVGVAAALPWIVVLIQNRTERRAVTGPTAISHRPRDLESVHGDHLLDGGWLLIFAGCSSNTFALFTWLPAVLIDRGFTPAAAGSMLALYAIIGLPTSLVVPLIVARMPRPFPIGWPLPSCSPSVTGDSSWRQGPAHPCGSLCSDLAKARTPMPS
jgi:CP family cyanate transporter-like MFS transporter